MATLVACMAETPRLSVGHEFGRRVMVLFLQLPLASCVVSKACTRCLRVENSVL